VCGNESAQNRTTCLITYMQPLRYRVNFVNLSCLHTISPNTCNDGGGVIFCWVFLLLICKVFVKKTSQRGQDDTMIFEVHGMITTIPLIKLGIILITFWEVFFWPQISKRPTTWGWQAPLCILKIYGYCVESHVLAYSWEHYDESYSLLHHHLALTHLMRITQPHYTVNGI
jgi:hypothetical protein